MKRLLAVSLLCLLLTGCAAPAADTSDAVDAGTEAAASAALPETEDLPVLSAPAVVTEGRPWTEEGELPTVPRELRGWDQEAEPVALLGWTEDAALYGLAGEEDRLLLRWGDTLAEFDWPYRTPRTVAPRLRQVDADGDGAEELAVVCCYGSGTGVSIEQLHIVEKNEDGTLTDYRLPEDDFCGGQLTAALRVETVEGRTFAVLGRELLEITELTEGRTPPQGLAAGSIVGFDVDPDDPYGVPIRFRGSAWLEGEDYLPTVWYAADLSACVRFENGMFTLSGLHLDGIE